MGLEQYFKIHDYLEKDIEWISTFSLDGWALIWWEHLLEVNRIKERKVDWDKVQKYFKDKYLSSWYYDNKRKEFYKIKLGNKNMEGHVQKFMELLRYVGYIKEERVKIQSILRGLSLNYRDRIEFSNIQTLEGTTRIVRHYYKQSKGKV